MKILFVHQNFPGQFKNLAPALAQRGHEVRALCINKPERGVINRENLHIYRPARLSTPNVHPFVVDFETKMIRAEACMREAQSLLRSGYKPDCIIAHHGWGEPLFLKEVWPDTKIAVYCEFFYHTAGADTNFDPEFLADDPVLDNCRIHTKNVNNILHLEVADAGISPTYWQASTFPERFKDKITVIHDGIDTDFLSPDPSISLSLTRNNKKLKLDSDSEIVTFVNRNLEPYRGYHMFMRSLPEILKRRKNATILIIGDHGVSYGTPPDRQKYGQRSWKKIFVDEIRGQLSDSEWERVYFLGTVSYERYRTILQLSKCHIYLTYPFVLSWSMLEAMSIGAPILASNTAPVREVIDTGENGLLVDFFDTEAISECCISLLEERSIASELGLQARSFVRENYDLETICLPRQISWAESLIG